ncbi:hypothetical protein AZE42_11250 [Rhizopogon vesiculosus]|uniref:Uncharacterized protein n=1 Tax=Rhizopogon vesiculosus TaxID=180088 RepID=A0A1J8Q4P1_9AGAM|nr:hypothetical protein AZE42_11250 [Rhizopogon vesiculosus]
MPQSRTDYERGFEVDTTTIRHCWRKSGILLIMDPPIPAQPIVPISSLCNIDITDQDPVANAENEVRSAHDDLQATGVLQPQNRMDIEALLNPHEESQMMDRARDEEICQAVLVARNAQEEGPINGGDDDVEDDSPLEPCMLNIDNFGLFRTSNAFGGIQVNVPHPSH